MTEPSGFELASFSDPSDPYALDDFTIKWKLRQNFAMSRAISSPLATMLTSDMVLPLSADGLEAVGRMREAAERRCEAAIRLFHWRPSWRAFWRCVKWGFLSGWRPEHDRRRDVREGSLRIERVSPWWVLEIMARFGLPFGGRG